jgi:hypothetical protein
MKLLWPCETHYTQVRVRERVRRRVHRTTPIVERPGLELELPALLVGEAEGGVEARASGRAAMMIDKLGFVDLVDRRYHILVCGGHTQGDWSSPGLRGVAAVSPVLLGPPVRCSCTRCRRSLTSVQVSAEMNAFSRLICIHRWIIPYLQSTNSQRGTSLPNAALNPRRRTPGTVIIKKGSTDQKYEVT